LRADKEAHLRAVLAGARSGLEALAGVVGTGVGLPHAGALAEDVCIQVFVSRVADREVIRAAVSALVPEDPFCIIITGPVQPLCI